MVFIRCVGHAINVPSTFPTVLTSNVGTGTAIDASLTFSTTTLEYHSAWARCEWLNLLDTLCQWPLHKEDFPQQIACTDRRIQCFKVLHITTTFGPSSTMSINYIHWFS